MKRKTQLSEREAALAREEKRQEEERERERRVELALWVDAHPQAWAGWRTFGIGYDTYGDDFTQLERFRRRCPVLLAEPAGKAFLEVSDCVATARLVARRQYVARVRQAL
jgi:hypothetical protein